MEWALSQALPLTPEALTEAEQRTLELVTRSVVDAYVSVGDDSSALDAARRAAMMAPADHEIARLHVKVLLGLGDETGAVKAARWPVTAREEDARSAYELADLLETLGRIAEVEALYRDEIIRQPFEPGWRLRLGRLLLQTNRWVEAEEEFDALVRWMDESPLPVSRRAELANAVASSLTDSNVAMLKAKHLVEYALTVDPGNPFYLDTLGMVLLREHNRMAAIRTFERALMRLNDPRIRAHLEAARR
jgi:tetratricopeptide (TPR) repeat protein